jgi:hypothetical protein
MGGVNRLSLSDIADEEGWPRRQSTGHPRIESEMRLPDSKADQKLYIVVGAPAT